MPLHAADMVNEELEVGFNQQFERRFYRVSLIGRLVMLVFVIGAAAGLYGHGPYSHATVRASDGSIWADYELVARYDTPTMVTVHMPNNSDQPRSVRLRLGNHFTEPLGFQRTIPLPNATHIDRQGMVLEYVVAPQQSDAMVRIALKPSTVGPVTTSIQPFSGPAFGWSQFIVP